MSRKGSGNRKSLSGKGIRCLTGYGDRFRLAQTSFAGECFRSGYLLWTAEAEERICQRRCAFNLDSEDLVGETMFLTSRRIFNCMLAGLVLCGLNASGMAQEKKQTVFQETLTTNDQWPIKLTYYKHEGKRDTPAVILLHSSQGDRRVWTSGFAEQLWKEGFAVVAVDLRKHGESKRETTSGSSTDVGDMKPDDYARMVSQDLDAVKSFLMEENQKGNLNIRKTSIVAPEMSVPIALNFAALDWKKVPYDDAPVASMRTPRGQDIRALVIISPQASVPGMNTAVPLRELRDPNKNITFLFCVGAEDPQDRGETKKMHQLVVGRSKTGPENVYLESYPYNLRGMALFGKKLRIEEGIIAVLKKHVQSLPDEWQDRRSRLQR